MTAMAGAGARQGGTLTVGCALVGRRHRGRMIIRKSIRVPKSCVQGNGLCIVAVLDPPNLVEYTCKDQVYLL